MYNSSLFDFYGAFELMTFGEEGFFTALLML